MSIHLFNMILNNNIYILYDFFACPCNMLKTRCIENLPTDKIFIQMVFAFFSQNLYDFSYPHLEAILNTM